MNINLKLGIKDLIITILSCVILLTIVSCYVIVNGAKSQYDNNRCSKLLNEHWVRNGAFIFDINKNTRRKVKED